MNQVPISMNSYAIVNLSHEQTRTYIGQTGMRKRPRKDRNKSWKSLERAPLQRMEEHLKSAWNSGQNQNESRKHSTLHRKMKTSPESWLMIPLATVPEKLRTQGKKIEDRWWGKFFPNTYNDQPPNGSVWLNKSTAALDRDAQLRIWRMSFEEWNTRINRMKIGLSILELICGLNKFKKLMTPSQVTQNPFHHL